MVWFQIECVSGYWVLTLRNGEGLERGNVWDSQEEQEQHVPLQSAHFIPCEWGQRVRRGYNGKSATELGMRLGVWRERWRSAISFLAFMVRVARECLLERGLGQGNRLGGSSRFCIEDQCNSLEISVWVWVEDAAGVLVLAKTSILHRVI